MKTRPCMHGDRYPAAPGKRKCVWHSLLKEPIEYQIEEAAIRENEVTGGRLDYKVIARVDKLTWPEGERFCAGCQGFVPLFYTTGSRCKAHAAAASHSGRLEKLYGIDRADYLALLELQGGVCFICGQTPRSKRLAVDHDHATGEVRGLLCADLERGCNHAVVGSLEARSVDGIVAAAYRLIQYIEHPPYRRLKEIQDDRGSEPNRTQQAPADAGADRDVAGGDEKVPVEPARGPDQDQDEPDWVQQQRTSRR